jgi:hypoxanthine phosphoribosyltransferase
MSVEINHIKGVRERAELLHSAHAVEQAVERLARLIEADLGDQDPLILCVMNGAVISSAMLLLRLAFPLRFDHVHATRYRGDIAGGELAWKSRPQHALQGEDVLVIDDIFDEGHTLELIVKSCWEQGAKSVRSAVLVEKKRSRDCRYRPTYIGLEVADRYVFGAGMDYREYWRNLPDIYAVADEDLR